MQRRQAIISSSLIQANSAARLLIRKNKNCLFQCVFCTLIFLFFGVEKPPRESARSLLHFDSNVKALEKNYGPLFLCGNLSNFMFFLSVFHSHAGYCSLTHTHPHTHIVIIFLTASGDMREKLTFPHQDERVEGR